MKLLILSDIHGNWPALDAILQTEKDFTAVAFCGDVVDYGPAPVRCIRWLKSHAAQVVRGNHDNALAFNLDCRCMGSFRPYSLATRAWHQTLLDDDDRGYLRRMPTIDWFEWNGRHFRMAHATPQGDVFEYLSPEKWGERVRDLDADFIVLGHTHVQAMRTFGAMTVVNPGSVGLARDGPGEACYAVCDGDRVILHRIPYDYKRTVRELRASPLSDDVVAGLTRVLSPTPLQKC
jgi:putative phosphoesterase